MPKRKSLNGSRSILTWNMVAISCRRHTVTVSLSLALLLVLILNAIGGSVANTAPTAFFLLDSTYNNNKYDRRNLLLFKSGAPRTPASAATVSLSSRFMTPRYDPDTRRWEPTCEEDTDGYDVVGSLLRQGPVPFVRRILDPDSYEQGVYKMMANGNMDRKQAQGNMDAYLQNPNDWALQKFEEQQGKVEEFDYASANMEQKDLILTGIWSSLLLSIILRIVYVTMMGCDKFCQDYHF